MNEGILLYHTVTYTRIVVDYRTQKEDTNRVRIMVGEISSNIWKNSPPGLLISPPLKVCGMV